MVNMTSLLLACQLLKKVKQKVNFTNGYMTDGARFSVLKDSGLANISLAGVAKVNMNTAGGKKIAAVGQMIAMFERQKLFVFNHLQLMQTLQRNICRPVLM